MEWSPRPSRSLHVSNFTTPASEERIQRTAAALRANNIDAIVVDTGEHAKGEVLARIPDGAEVHSGASKTTQLVSMDRAAQGREIRLTDLDEAMRRIYEHALPLESERLRAILGVDSHVSKLLITNREARAGRTTAILVREALGF